MIYINMSIILEEINEKSAPIVIVRDMCTLVQ